MTCASALFGGIVEMKPTSLHRSRRGSTTMDSTDCTWCNCSLLMFLGGWDGMDVCYSMRSKKKVIIPLSFCTWSESNFGTDLSLAIIKKEIPSTEKIRDDD